MTDPEKPMPRTAVAELVRASFARLEHASDPSWEASQLLRRAYTAALAGERQHRRGVGGRYSMSTTTAAKYFVCKWFTEPARVTNAREACSMRGDCLHATALRELLNSENSAPSLPGISNLDYCRDIVRAAP